MSEEHKCTEDCIGQLEEIVARLQEEHQEDLRRIQQLEEENDRLKVVIEALKVQKDPDQQPIPWDKVKQDLRIQQLREALRFYADEENWHVYEHIEGPAVARAVLSSEAPTSKLGEPAILQDEERCVHTYSEGPGAPRQRCVLKKNHYGWHAWGEASEAPEKEEG